MTLPLVISCGEPAGIGPEIAVSAWAALRQELTFVWLGDPGHLPKGTSFKIVETVADASDVMPNALPVLPQPFVAAATPGRPDFANAPGVISTIRACVELVQSGAASALVTAPINKQVLKEGAGFAFPGHTEYLQELGGGSGRAVMMLASPDLRVVPTTIHIPLCEVPAALTPDLLRETIRVTADSLQSRFAIAQPRIAVAGLNPHAGEGGAIGAEEGAWIKGVIDEFAKEGLQISGPHPADTMFHAAARQGYDAAVCMYHDQALIPIKTIDFERGVNVTLGLPFIRTSPDHGTAFDIAGRGIADPTSMIEACRLAWSMAQA